MGERERRFDAKEKDARSGAVKVHAMPGVRYRHAETGGFYEVVDLATIEATGELAVVYKSTENGRRWIRPYDEFCDGRFEFADAR